VNAPSSAPQPQGSGRLEWPIPATLKAVSQVRRALEHLGLPPALLDDARLLATELVTNSIQHAGLRPHDFVRVRAHWSGTRLRVEVRDRTETASPSQLAGAIRPSPGAESGWGLFLVDRLASRWGTDPGRYWFELELGEPNEQDR
jgi:anti-sigma regulatory factor (Ser/Thr protein kinase)